jgi:hypothetical protein
MGSVCVSDGPRTEQRCDGCEVSPAQRTASVPFHLFKCKEGPPRPDWSR